MKRSSVVGLGLLVLALHASAQEPVPLPPPRMDGGMPLMSALRARSSSREFSDKPLGAQVISDLLWAACGINRPESGRRTAPSAMNKQEMDVYLFCASEGLVTVIRAWFDPKALAEGLKLSSTQRPVLAQTVGYPKD